MRDYAKVASTFWTGATGRRLRGDPAAQVLALYLLSCPHASMSGIYVISIASMANDTGLSADQVRGALKRLEEEDFAYYDANAELVWVVNMIRYQVGEVLDERDKRTSALCRQLAPLRGHPFIKALRSRSEGAYCLPDVLEMPLRRPIEAPSIASFRQGIPRDEAPSKPLRSQEQDQEQEQEQDQEQEQTHVELTALVAAERRPETDSGLAAGGVVSPASLVSPQKSQIAEVVKHYQRYHPRSFPRGLRSDTPEYRKLKARLAEGFSVDDLKACIDGYEGDPWHQGVNEKSTAYLALELFVRDAKHVQKGIELGQRHPALKGMTEKSLHNTAALGRFMARTKGGGDVSSDVRQGDRDDGRGVPGAAVGPGDRGLLGGIRSGG